MPADVAVRLRGVVRTLATLYGPIDAPVTDPFEMILLESASYLVDDHKRLATFEKLRKEIGTVPGAILEHSADDIARVIAAGGMQPRMRAGKVMEAARLADGIGPEILNATVKRDPQKAKKLLREFPSVGEPYADRILLFAGSQVTLAPDSNALRVLARLGFVGEEKSYSKMYRAAISATTDVFENAAGAQRAHLLLRKHGQELCKRSAPRCDLCPLRAECVWYAGVSRP
ncbi:MAG: hypothetical protein ACXV7D_02550 [Thermoanaerobaculia bacterium]